MCFFLFLFVHVGLNFLFCSLWFTLLCPYCHPCSINTVDMIPPQLPCIWSCSAYVTLDICYRNSSAPFCCSLAIYTLRSFVSNYIFNCNNTSLFPPILTTFCLSFLLYFPHLVPCNLLCILFIMHQIFMYLLTFYLPIGAWIYKGRDFFVFIIIMLFSTIENSI